MSWQKKPALMNENNCVMQISNVEWKEKGKSNLWRYFVYLKTKMDRDKIVDWQPDELYPWQREFITKIITLNIQLPKNFLYEDFSLEKVCNLEFNDKAELMIQHDSTWVRILPLFVEKASIHFLLHGIPIWGYEIDHDQVSSLTFRAEVDARMKVPEYSDIVERVAEFLDPGVKIIHHYRSLERNRDCIKVSKKELEELGIADKFSIKIRSDIVYLRGIDGDVSIYINELNKRGIKWRMESEYVQSLDPHDIDPLELDPEEIDQLLSNSHF